MELERRARFVAAGSVPVAVPESPSMRGALDWLLHIPYWALSAVVHLAVLAMLINVTWRTEYAAKESRTVIFTTNAIPAQRPPPFDPVPQRATEYRQRIPRPPAENAVVDLREHEIEPTESPAGSPDAIVDVSIVETGRGVHDVSGVGRYAAACFGDRTGDGPPAPGGGRATSNTVSAALEWLRRHQSPDGSWKAHDFTEMCKKPCAGKDSARYGDGRGFATHDVGVTGLALLAFAGDGHTHRFSRYPEYVDCVAKGLAYLRSVQVKSVDPNTNGRFGSDADEQWIYDHAIATFAMCELLLMSGDVLALKRPATDAVNLCLRAQNPGMGWKYGIQPGRNDTSVTGWMVLALKVAKYCKLDIPAKSFDAAFDGALAWIERATSSATGITGYEVTGDEGSRLLKAFPEPFPYSKSLSCMTAVGVLCRIFAGEPRSSPAVKSGVAALEQHKPNWAEQRGKSLSTINLYYWYYASCALFQHGGKPWADWNKSMVDALVGSQRQEPYLDEDGSWDPIDEWGPAGGRVYATAMGALTLEVSYRYKRM